jgi:hypothetical protein
MDGTLNVRQVKNGSIRWVWITYLTGTVPSIICFENVLLKILVNKNWKKKLSSDSYIYHEANIVESGFKHHKPPINQPLLRSINHIQMGVNHLPNRDKQPFYNVFVDDGSNRYAAQGMYSFYLTHCSVHQEHLEQCHIQLPSDHDCPYFSLQKEWIYKRGAAVPPQCTSCIVVLYCYRSIPCVPSIICFENVLLKILVNKNWKKKLS